MKKLIILLAIIIAGCSNPVEPARNATLAGDWIENGKVSVTWIIYNDTTLMTGANPTQPAYVYIGTYSNNYRAFSGYRGNVKMGIQMTSDATYTAYCIDTDTIIIKGVRR